MKIKLQIKNRFTDSIIFEYEKENNTISETVKEFIRQEVEVNKKSYANLSYADLSSADLSSADLDKRYISISCIGSFKRITTYCFEDDIVWCGCFTGTLQEFEDAVNKTHKDNEKYLKEYIGFINYLKSLK